MLIPLVLWHIAYTKKVPVKRFISPLMLCIEVGVFSLVQDKIKGAFEEEKENGLRHHRGPSEAPGASGKRI